MINSLKNINLDPLSKCPGPALALHVLDADEDLVDQLHRPGGPGVGEREPASGLPQ